MPPYNDSSDDDSSASSTPLFESPAPSVSNDDYLPEDALSPPPAKTAANSRRKSNTFDLPALNSQDDSIIEGQSSPTLLLATQPSSQTRQPSTPSPVPTKAANTSLVNNNNNNNNNKGKKRKVSMSPTDSLARTKQNNGAVATERRTSPRKKVKNVPKQQQEIIEIQEENDDHNVIRSTSSEMEYGETSTTKGNELIKPAKPTEPRGGVDDSLETSGDKKRKVKQSSTCRQNLAAQQRPPDTATIKYRKEEKESSSMTTTTETTNAAAKKKTVATKKKKSLVASNIHPDENIEKIGSTSSSNSKSSKKRPQKVDISSLGPPSKKKPKKAASSATSPGTTSNSKTKTVNGASQSNETDAAVTSVTSSTAAAESKKRPPKKKKRSFENRLLHHLFTSCKPSTIKDLAKQLDTNETAINHCMLSLTDKGWISKKEFTSKGGRSKELVWANQSAVNKYKGLSDALRMASSQEISAAKEQCTKLEKEDKQLAQSMEQVTKEPSNEELDGLLAEAQAKVSELEQKRDSTLARIEKANDNNDSKRQQSKSTQPAQVGRKKKQYRTAAKKNTPRGLKNRINSMRDEWKKRKNKCMDFVDNLADGMEKRVKDVVKLLDIETDESEGVKMPPKYVLN